MSITAVEAKVLAEQGRLTHFTPRATYSFDLEWGERLKPPLPIHLRKFNYTLNPSDVLILKKKCNFKSLSFRKN